MLSKLFGSTLEIGSNAPDFEAKDQDGVTRRLADYRGRWLILYFYPKDDTPGCTAEACSFRDDREDLAKLNATVVGVSVDPPESHAGFAQKHRLNFPIL